MAEVGVGHHLRVIDTNHAELTKRIELLREKATDQQTRLKAVYAAVLLAKPKVPVNNNDSYER